MNILLLGSGGREHAFAWKISQSPLCKKLFIAPGNAGTSQCGNNINISVNDFHAIKSFVLENRIEMVVVGPEDPLVNGITDFFKSDIEIKHIAVIGPSKMGAMLEGSKDFAKAFMQRHGIPTARYKSFTWSNYESGVQFLDSLQPPYVLKADGLAAGKGVLILDDKQEAKHQLKEILSGKKFGKAGATVVIEEFLKGIELSVFVITDGKNYKILPEAKDYKRIGENDTGPNTGGTGAVSPVPFAGKDFMSKVEKKIIQPTIEGLIKEKISYCGFIFFGLIKVHDDPCVIEYNCRMGDPETEVVIPRIKSDLVEIFLATAKGNLDKIKINFDSRSAATVMLVSDGYPGTYEKGKVIHGLEHGGESLVFHAGTVLKNGKVLSSGGRVLSVTSLAPSLDEALIKSYDRVGKISFENKYFRKDIGKDVLNYAMN